MPALLLYLLKANVALALFYLAYHFVLRRLTFYTLNRAFLLFGVLFSVLYPLLDLSDWFSQHEELTVVNTYVTAIPAFAVAPAAPGQAPTFDYWFIPVYLFWLGAAVVVIRLMMQFVSLYKIHTSSEPARHRGVGYREVRSISHAFSFWQSIYLNPEQHKQHELDAILNHELVHVKGWHTLDVLLAELSALFYWFNPGGWLMKKAVKENLEFIADQKVVAAGVDRKDYQYLLLKVTGVSEPHIANQFNFSPLKTRIAMMNKVPTSRTKKLRLLVVLPLVAVLLVAFRGTSQNAVFVATTEEFTTPITFQDGGKDLPQELKGLLENNSNIKNVRVKLIENRNAVVINLRKGGTEVYYLDDTNSIAALKDKYTQSAELPPPPPPSPQDPNEPFTLFLDELEYYKDKARWPADYKDFLKRNPTVEKVGWKFSDRKDWNLESIIIYLKSGKTEEYNYNKSQRIPAAEAKYGTLPQLPPPPPPSKPEKPDTPPPPPADEHLPAPPPPLPDDIPVYIPETSNMHDDHKAFLKRNPVVKEIGWIAREHNNRNLRLIVLYLDNGKSEIYDLNNKASIAEAEKKYGELPQLPPPPPPVRKKN
ncbi:M56 family metallopeptidase [Pontibacter locisalis]|uniref:M56 family metallopeptidase n=1 Tax=Pontibacter locisalis TaxID=1719035 RepID=A0ABW5IVW8_9BACT